jgi:hypothetical protein
VNVALNLSKLVSVDYYCGVGHSQNFLKLHFKDLRLPRDSVLRNYSMMRHYQLDYSVTWNDCDRDESSDDLKSLLVSLNSFKK